MHTKTCLPALFPHSYRHSTTVTLSQHTPPFLSSPLTLTTIPGHARAPRQHPTPDVVPPHGQQFTPHVTVLGPRPPPHPHRAYRHRLDRPRSNLPTAAPSPLLTAGSRSLTPRHGPPRLPHLPRRTTADRNGRPAPRTYPPRWPPPSSEASGSTSRPPWRRSRSTWAPSQS